MYSYIFSAIRLYVLFFDVSDERIQPMFMLIIYIINALQCNDIINMSNHMLSDKENSKLISP